MFKLSNHYLSAGIIAFTLMNFQTGCVHSLDSDVSMAETPEDDEPYAAALERATVSKTVFKDFETRYGITATILSNDFRAAFTERLKRVYHRDDVVFDEATNKIGFFVSIHSPNSDITNLNDEQLWTIQLLNEQNNSSKPLIIKSLSANKERWRAFFPAVSPWTKEYLIVFELPTPSANNIQLLLANADAKVHLKW